MKIKHLPLIVLAFSIITASAQVKKKKEITATVTPAASTEIPRPKLVVGIVVDQMRWDYLYRFYARYQNNGFKRLMKRWV